MSAKPQSPRDKGSKKKPIEQNTGRSTTKGIRQPVSAGKTSKQGKGSGTLKTVQLDSVPTLTELRPMIAIRAHELFEQRGRVHGDDLVNWSEAERQIFTHISPG